MVQFKSELRCIIHPFVNGYIYKNCLGAGDTGAVFLCLTNLSTLDIICLTGQPEGECKSPDPAQLNNNHKISRPTFTREQDGYFLCLV